MSELSEFGKGGFQPVESASDEKDTIGVEVEETTTTWPMVSAGGGSDFKELCAGCGFLRDDETGTCGIIADGFKPDAKTGRAEFDTATMPLPLAAVRQVAKSMQRQGGTRVKLAVPNNGIPGHNAALDNAVIGVSLMSGIVTAPAASAIGIRSESWPVGISVFLAETGLVISAAVKIYRSRQTVMKGGIEEVGNCAGELRNTCAKHNSDVKAAKLTAQLAAQKELEENEQAAETAMQIAQGGVDLSLNPGDLR
jgi:hypothetical protein